MKILALETSCDETSCAITQDGRKVLSNVIASQVEIHRPYGGVVPEIAARKHIEALSFVVSEALTQANATLSDIDAYAVANGPGLIGALLVGLSYTKSLAFAQQKPLIGVHHIEGHICANYLENTWEPPFICLVVSGGHTMIAQIEDYRHYTVLGRTRDDAAGEAFDKVARTLGLPYPGGPHIDALASKGNAQAIRFPRTVFSDGDLDFSFSGLKSAVIQYLSKAKKEGEPVLADVAASFQAAVVEVLTDHTLIACERAGLRKVALAGGVACNSALREAMRRKCQARGFESQMPLPLYCTDNAAMIACRGYYDLINGMAHSLDLNAFPSGAV